MNIGTNMHDDIAEVLYTEEEIKTRVKELGKQISIDYKGKYPLLIGILKGVTPFYADLIREIDCQLEMEFMCISSYSDGTESTGLVQIVKDVAVNLKGRDVLIVEDIIDSGHTLQHLVEVFETRKPNSIRIACLLDKKERRDFSCSIVPSYTGFICPNEFVVGYGLDFAQYYRNLKYIGILKPSVYGE